MTAARLRLMAGLLPVAAVLQLVLVALPLVVDLGAVARLLGVAAGIQALLLTVLLAGLLQRDLALLDRLVVVAVVLAVVAPLSAVLLHLATRDEDGAFFAGQVLVSAANGLVVLPIRSAVRKHLATVSPAG